jgi:hypothetical protein
MEKHNWGLAKWSLGMFDNGLGQIKTLLGGSPYLMPEDDSIMVTPPYVAHVDNKNNNEHHKTSW